VVGWSLGPSTFRYRSRVIAHGTTPRRLLVDGVDVGPCVVADTHLDRLRGLLGRRRFEGGLVLMHCTSVHGVGMVMTLDVALLDDDLTVRHVRRLTPFGLVMPRRGVRHVLEAQRGAFQRWGLQPGSRLGCRPVDATLGGGPR
jgi:uncharacterized protein